MRCESYAPTTDPRIIGAYTVGGVTYYTYATEGPSPQLEPIAMANAPAPEESRPVVLPPCGSQPAYRSRGAYPKHYRRESYARAVASYVRAFHADSRSWGAAPTHYRAARRAVA